MTHKLAYILYCILKHKPKKRYVVRGGKMPEKEFIEAMKHITLK
jgi:hypothetical protein